MLSGRAKRKMNQRVISLGANCMVTEEIRRFFGIQTANMFDWWITPGDSLVLLVENDFEDLFSPEYLQLVGDRQSVAHSRYGILLHHDFPRNEHGRVIKTDGDVLEGNQKKFAYLKKRWDDLGDNDAPVLFVRYTWKRPEALLAGIPAEPISADPARLMAALDRKFPRLDYQVLFIDAPEISVQHPRARYLNSWDFTQPGECLNSADLAWKDNIAIFARLFSTIELR